MKKLAICGVVIISILALVGGVFWWSRPQVIRFDDGDKLILLGVDYGKHHSPPGNKKAAKSKNPRNGAFDTQTKALVVWIRQEHQPNQYRNYQYYLYDKAGTACVGTSGYRNNGNQQQGNEVVAVQFDAFPRRQGKCVLRAQKYGPQGPEMAASAFVIRNPARGPFSSLTATDLPITQVDDDLSVTLTKLVASADTPYRRNQADENDAINKAVEVTFQVERNGKAVTNWQPTSVITSDGTGNSCRGWISQNNWTQTTDVASYQYGLWLDEPAWKVRFEFSQQSDFIDSELWSVPNIPVQPGLRQDFYNFSNYSRRGITNTPFAETDLNGFHLKLFGVSKFTDDQPGNQQEGGFHIQSYPSLPDGMLMTLVKVTDNKGLEIPNNGSGWSGGGRSTTYNYQLREMEDATNVNLVIALHKSRFVEFNVKPK